MDATLTVNPEILKTISRIDQFRDIWAGGTCVAPERLSVMRTTARVQSVAASCRIAGIRASDSDVAAMLAGARSNTDEGAEVTGYAAAIDRSFPAHGPIVTLDEIAALNAVVMGKTGNPPPPSALREAPLHLEVFDSEGRAQGRVLQTLPPRLLQDKIEDLLSWLELELRGGEHALLVAGTFFIYLMSISPFERGNGRTAG
jgi:Fic family protein